MLQMCGGQHQILRTKSPFMISPSVSPHGEGWWQHLDSAHSENTGSQWKNLCYSPQLSKEAQGKGGMKNAAAGTLEEPAQTSTVVHAGIGG